jgi:signal peptidase I
MFGKKKDKPVKRKKNIIQEYVEAILFAFVVAMLIRNYTIQNFKIPSSSMEGTLLIGDYLIGNKLKYFFTDPQREDIVIFYYPADPVEPEPRDRFLKILGPVYFDKNNWFFKWHQKKNVVKRVIGMPGDKIELINKKVYINDELFERKYEQYIDSRIIPRGAKGIDWDGEYMGSRDNFGPVIVPEDSYFVLGDNRDVSGDSRYWGFLPRDAVTGTPGVITFSYGAQPIRDIRDMYFKQHHKFKTKNEFRWERLFKLVH